MAGKYTQMPRPARANNPGAIRYNAANNWQGRATLAERTPEQRLEHEFEVFKAPEWGIRALAVTLISYYDRYQLDTVAKIIGRWAPPNENNTSSYIMAVAQRMNVNPTLPLNLHDYDVLRPLVEGIIQHENGMQPYSDAVIDKGLALASVMRPIKPISESRTVGGAGLAGASTAVSGALQAAQSVDDIKGALAPLESILPYVQYALIALTLAGVALAIYARISDQSRRVT